MEYFNSNIETANDGLFIPEVRSWSLEKYKLVGSYCDIFTAGMKYKWQQLVYIDLFAGAGIAKIKETGKIYKNSALLAMSIPNPFTSYILCEQDPERFQALKQRVERDYSHLNVKLVCGDSNLTINEVISLIPKYSKDNRVLPFCFVDPFSLNLHFNTISSLASTGLMDFLILQALHMDANRNFDIYFKEENSKVADYLGISHWRELFEKDGKIYKQDFVRFLADQYQNQMSKLGYQTSKHVHLIRSNEKNLPLYYLSFYSRNPRGEDFFSKVQKRLTPQTKLEF